MSRKPMIVLIRPADTPVEVTHARIPWLSTLLTSDLHVEFERAAGIFERAAGIFDRTARYTDPS